MAITFTNLGSSAAPDFRNGGNATSYTTASWTPPSSGLIILFVFSAVSATTAVEPTVSGNSLTWTKIISVVAEPSGNAQRITLFGANAAGSSAGVTTIDFGTETQLSCTASFIQATGVDLSGGVAAAFVQTPTNSGAGATSGSVTLSAAGSSNNRPVAAFMHAANEASTPRTNWTEADDFNGSGPTEGLETQYRSDAFETTASATWTSSANWNGLAAEIKAGGAYNLTASAGSYSLSGVTSTLLFKHLISAAVGSYSLSGVTVTLAKGRTMTAAAGSYALSGVTSTLLFKHLMAVAVGSYSLTGVSAGTLRGYPMVAGAGSYSLSGVNAALLHKWLISASAGSYSLSGVNANLLFKHLMSAGLGSYALSGVNANLLHGWMIGASAGSYSLSGISANPLFGRLLSAAVGSYSLSGVDAGLLHKWLLAAAIGSYSLTGVDVGLVHGSAGSFTLVAETGNYVLSGIAASLLFKHLMSAALGTYDLSGISAGLLHGWKLMPDAGIYVLTGLDVSLIYGQAGAFTLVADLGTYSLVGQNVLFPRTRIFSVQPGSYNLLGLAVLLSSASALARLYVRSSSASVHNAAAQSVAVSSIADNILSAGAGSANSGVENVEDADTALYETDVSSEA